MMYRRHNCAWSTNHHRDNRFPVHPAFKTVSQSIAVGYIGTASCVNFREVGNEVCATLTVPKAYFDAGVKFRFNPRGSRATQCYSYNGAVKTTCLPDIEWNALKFGDKYKYGREGNANRAEIFCHLN
eukprot:Pgem_evm2s11620